MSRQFLVVALLAVTQCATLCGRGESLAEEPSAPPVELTGKVIDESGRPVVGATVESTDYLANHRIATTDAAGDFRLSARPSDSGYVFASLRAQTLDDKLGYVSVSQRITAIKPAEIIVKPARGIAVLVCDANNQPVPGADVEVLGDMRRLADGKTDEQGRWSAIVPADTKSWSVFAKKGGVGFDYATASRGRGNLAEPKPLPTEVTLMLDGAYRLSVKAVDNDQQPVAGVSVGLWLAKKPNYESEINLSGTSDRWPETNDQGIAVLDWLPAKVERGWSIIYRAKDHFAIDHAFSIPVEKPVDELTINLLPLEELSGRVTFADGRPAADIPVRVQGKGGGMDGFSRGTQTDADGRYRIRAHSQQAYVIAAGNKAWAAPCRTDVVLRVGQPAHDADLVLGPAIRVHGHVTVGDDNHPAPKTSISAVIGKEQIPDDLRSPGDRVSRPIAMWFYTQTDNDGEYELFLGPGEYRLQGPPRTESRKLTITADNAVIGVVHDFKMPRPETAPFTIRVVDAQGQPVSGAIVNGHYAARAPRLFQQAMTDAQGTLKVERSLDPLVLHARSADGRFGGMVRADAQQPEAKIAVGEMAAAAGRLLNLEGEPLAGKELRYGIIIYQGEPKRSPFWTGFGGVVTTDDDGRFTLKQLVPGERYEGSIKIDEHSSRRVVTASPSAAGTTELGDIKADPLPSKPYVPPTPAERTAEAFSITGKPTPRQRLDNVLAGAHQMYTQPLVVFGNATDPACVDLFRLFYDDEKTAATDARNNGQKTPTASDLRWEFELLSLSPDDEQVRQLADELGVKLAAACPPALAVLGQEGNLKATYDLRLAEGKLDAAALASFLLKHKLPTRDAEQLLADGLKQAGDEKRVFFICSASWCGPCRMLARFLDQSKAVFEPHFVFVKLDVSRDAHAEELRKRYKESQSGGVPWFAILDSHGKTLVTSNAPELDEGGNTNIGYPSEPKAVDHFLRMLQQTAPRMDDKTRGELKKKLSTSH